MPSNSSSSQNTRIFAPYAILTQDTSRLAIKISTGQGYSIVSGITSGDVVRFNPQYSSGGLVGQYVKSQANSDENAEVLGVVESISGNYYTIVTHGSILYPSSKLIGICGGAGGVDVLFLDSGISGGLTGTVVSGATESIVKPVLQLAPHGSFYNGIVVNYIGFKIGANTDPTQQLITTGDGNDIGIIGAGAIQYAPELSSLSSNWINISSPVVLSVKEYPELYEIYGPTNGPYVEQITISSAPNSNLLNTIAYQIQNGYKLNAGTVVEVNATNKTINILRNNFNDPGDPGFPMGPPVMCTCKYMYPLFGVDGYGCLSPTGEYPTGIIFTSLALCRRYQFRSTETLDNVGRVLHFGSVSGSSLTKLTITKSEIINFTISAIENSNVPYQGGVPLIPYINKSSISPVINIPKNLLLNNISIGGTCAIGSITNVETKIQSLQYQIDTLNSRFM